jgi:hypothetical protein
MSTTIDLGARLIQAANEAREIIQRPVVQEIMRLKAEAEAGPIGKKRSSFELYALLADCHGLAVQIHHNSEDRQALIDLLRPADYSAKNRKGQVNKNSSAFQLVCRFVFQHKGVSHAADRSNASRYGKALEEAWKRGIGPTQIERHLRKHGGINSLFLVRPLGRRDVRSKNIYLETATTLPKEGEVTLVLRRNPNGSFTVVSNSYEK